MTKSLHNSFPVTGPPSIPACPGNISPLSEQNLYIHRASGPFQKAAGSTFAGGGALLATGRADAQPHGRAAGPAGADAAAAAAERRPPPSPSQIRSRRCRFTLCRSMSRAGTRRPRRRGRTRDPSPAARAAPRNRKGAAGPTRATPPPLRCCALPLPVAARGRAPCGPGAGSGAGPGSLARCSWATAAPGADQEGAYKKLGGASWDVAAGLSRKLSVHETKRGVIQIGSASVLPLLGLPHLSHASGSGAALQYLLVLRIQYINHHKDITKQILYSSLKNKLKPFITQTFLVPDVKFMRLIYFHTALFLNTSHIQINHYVLTDLCAFLLLCVGVRWAKSNVIIGTTSWRLCVGMNGLKVDDCVEED